MNRTTFDAMLAQYKKQDVSGEGAVSWDKGVRCVLPEVLVYGKAVQDGTPTPDAPVMPEFSVGTEVACRGKNLFDESLRNLPSWKDVVNGTVVELLANGIVVRGGISDHTQQNAYSKGWYRPGYYGYANGVGMMLQAGETVTISCDYTLLEDVWSDIPKLIGIHLYGASGQESSHETSFGEGDTVHLEQSFTLTTTGLHYPVFTLNSCMVKITNIQIEFGDIATPYVPYFDGGTAVAPELLAIPGTEYRDTWNPQTGKGVRRVVRFEHDGSETWLKNASMGEYESFYVPKKATIPSANSIACHGLCNMFPSVEWGYIKEIEGNYFWNHTSSCGFRIHKSCLGDDYDTLATDAEKINRFKAFLADKAAAGTPIIVWLPANDEPFQTAPAPLIAPKGTGHIMQVGGNLDGVPIGVKYVTHS